MVLAIAALFLQIAPVAHALPDVALGSTIPIVSTASADAKPDQPKPSGVSSASAEKDPAVNAPARLTAASLESTSQNSQALSTIRVPEPLPSKPVRVIAAENENYSRRSWMLLSIAQHSAATFDAYSTRVAVSNGAREADPMMRPFAHSPGIYAAIQVGPTILDFAARRMQRSQNSFLRRTWWLPQTASTGIFLFSGVHNMSVANQALASFKKH
ncbi:MAG: hypothetical protein P4L00_07820 [Candidatus Acidoferrales bacterium]|nr:hypothetical protein [Candidatus Acidoferrales bacterium]